MKSLSLNQPHLIIMVGVPGSGKSFFAEKFSQTFGAPYVSSEKITELAQADQEMAKQLAHYQLHELLKTRQSIVIEGFADTRAERMELAKIARTAKYETLLLWVQIDPATAKARTTRATKNKEGRILSPEEHDQLVKRFTAPSTVEHPIVISGKHTYATQAKVVLKKLSAPRAEISIHTTPVSRAEPKTGRRNITIR